MNRYNLKTASHHRDDELFNHKLVDLEALKNYGGGSDLALAREYLESFSASSSKMKNWMNCLPRHVIL
jgi:hypothetical protein